MQKVCVDRKRRLAFFVLRDWYLVLAREGQELLAALERPLAPRGDDLDARLERVVAKLEAHLIVALAGGAMTHGVGSDLSRDLDLLFCDQRPRDRGAEQVYALVNRVGAEHRKYVVAHEFFAQIFD